MLSKREPVYQALWAGPCDFDEVLISPVMIQDHMPDSMLKALNKVSQADSIIVGQIKKAQHSPASRSPSVKLGHYEPLEETMDDPDITKEEDLVVPVVIKIDDGSSNRKQVHFANPETSENSASFVVDVEVYERKETQPGSY